MNPNQRLQDWKIHDSIRGYFGHAIYQEMAANEDIWLITADLGYGLFDAHRDDFPERFVNCGASEQLAVGMGVGLALSGKVPFVYSITTFLLFRAFEWHRNYVNHEKIPVRLVGSGKDDDYKHDGISHQPYELYKVLSMFDNIETFEPNFRTDIPNIVSEMVEVNRPSFICLRR